MDSLQTAIIQQLFSNWENITSNLFIYLFILSFRNHSVITIIWHEMYSLKFNVRRCQQVILLSRPLFIDTCAFKNKNEMHLDCLII